MQPKTRFAYSGNVDLALGLVAAMLLALAGWNGSAVRGAPQTSGKWKITGLVFCRLALNLQAD